MAIQPKNIVRNFLSRQEMRKLQDYVADHKDAIENNKLTRERILEVMEKRLKTKVTVHNIRGACETMGVKLPNLQGKTKSYAPNKEQLNKIKNTLALLIADYLNLNVSLSRTPNEELLEPLK